MVYGTWTAYLQSTALDPDVHFGSPLAAIPFTDTKGDIALTAVVLNLIVTVVLTFVLPARNVPEGTDHTTAEDYEADAGDKGAAALPQVP